MSVSNQEERDRLQGMVLDQLEGDDQLPSAPKEERTVHPTSVRIPIRLRAVMDDLRNELYGQGIDFPFNSFIVWALQLAVEYTIKAIRTRNPILHQYLTEVRLQKRVKSDKEEYEAALEFCENMLKDLERTQDNGDVDRVGKILMEWEKANGELKGWRGGLYQRYWDSERAQNVRRKLETTVGRNQSR